MTVGRRACPRNQSSPRPRAAMASTGAQLWDGSLCTAWATTGDTVPTVAAPGQNRSVNPEGRALRMVALSRCRRAPRLLMVIPLSRTCLLMKLITTGAAMVSRVVIAPDGRPDSRPIAPVTVFSELPNRAGSMRLPIDKMGELGSVTAGSNLGPGYGFRGARNRIEYSSQCAGIFGFTGQAPQQRSDRRFHAPGNGLLGLAERLGDLPNGALVQRV